MEDLKPCPFCGGKAERIDIEDGDNAGGSCVVCSQCNASSNVEFEFKENFVSNWNRRSPDWRSITSAPKDGTWILGWSDRDSSPYRISWGRNHSTRLAWCTSFCSFNDGYITHWMPLPAAPSN